MHPKEGLYRKIFKTFFLCMKFILNILHSMTWRIIGRPKEYEASAEVFQILLRFKPCYYTCHFLEKEDFIGIHESFCHPDIIFQDNIYFYGLTESEACFVDCGDTDVFADFPFTGYGLHYKAVRMITMPISSFHAIAKEIPTPNIPVLLVSNHGRCGSTLLANLFKDIPNTLSLSEAPTFTAIAELSRIGKLPVNELKRLCQSSYALTVKHANARKSSFLFMKAQNIDLFICDIIFEAIPSLKQVFLYRQPLPTIRSYEKLQALNNWEPITVRSLKFNGGIGQHRLVEGLPIVSDEFIESLTNFGRYSLKWAYSVAGYNKLVARGYPIKAIKYDDIIKDPKPLFTSLLSHADIPLSNLPDINKVMLSDSQAGTGWSSRQVSTNFFEGKLTEVIDDVKIEVEMICEKFDVPRFWGSVDIPNKISL